MSLPPALVSTAFIYYILYLWWIILSLFVIDTLLKFGKLT